MIGLNIVPNLLSEQRSGTALSYTFVLCSTLVHERSDPRPARRRPTGSRPRSRAMDTGQAAHLPRGAVGDGQRRARGEGCGHVPFERAPSASASSRHAVRPALGSCPGAPRAADGRPVRVPASTRRTGGATPVSGRRAGYAAVTRERRASVSQASPARRAGVASPTPRGIVMGASPRNTAFTRQPCQRPLRLRPHGPRRDPTGVGSLPTYTHA